MTAWASRNGDIGRAEEVSVPVTDRGFLLGDAVFETLRTYRGRLFAADLHLDRLEASMAAIGLEAPPRRADVARWMEAAVAKARGSAAGEWVVRVTVTRGSGGPGVSPRGAGPAETFVLVRPLPAAARSVYEDGIRVVTASTRRVAPHTQDPRIKATSALHLVLARQEADAAGADEALLCDAGGDYLEATSANLVALKGGRYHTPRGDNGVLEGVTLALVAPMLEAEGFRPAHGAIAPATLLSADEVLLTQTTREVVAVVAIDGRRVGSGRPGPVALALRERFLAQVGGWLS